MTRCRQYDRALKVRADQEIHNALKTANSEFVISDQDAEFNAIVAMLAGVLAILVLI
jgi:hypothetical protein